MPMNKLIVKKDVVYIWNGILLSHEKGAYHVICDNMDGRWAHYAKWDELENGKYCMTSFICGI